MSIRSGLQPSGMLSWLLVVLSAGVAIGAAESGDRLEIDSGELNAVEWWSAFVQPQKVAVLGCETDGVVAEISAEPQEFVKAGDALVGLDRHLIELNVKSTQAELDGSTDVAEAQVKLEYESDNFVIIERLHGKEIANARVGSTKEFNEARQRRALAKLAVKRAELAMELLRLKLEHTQAVLEKHTVRAPMDGVIVPFSSVKGYEELKAVAVGEMVRAGGRPVVAMMKVDYLRVSETMPVSRLDEVHLGQDARVYIEGAVGEAVVGKVVFKDPALGSTGQFNFDVEFANPLLEGDLSEGAYRYRFRPGMRARVELVGGPDDRPMEEPSASDIELPEELSLDDEGV